MSSTALVTSSIANPSSSASTSRSALVALLVGVVGGMLCMLRFERLPGKAKTPRIDGGNDKKSYQSRLVGPRFCFQGMKSPRFTGPGLHRNHIVAGWMGGCHFGYFTMVLPVEWIPCCGRVCCEKNTISDILQLLFFLVKKCVATLLGYQEEVIWTEGQLQRMKKRQFLATKMPHRPLAASLENMCSHHIYPQWPCTNGMNARNADTRRITWLNANVFQDRQIDKEAWTPP